MWNLLRAQALAMPIVRTCVWTCVDRVAWTHWIRAAVNTWEYNSMQAKKKTDKKLRQNINLLGKASAHMAMAIKQRDANQRTHAIEVSTRYISMAKRFMGIKRKINSLFILAISRSILHTRNCRCSTMHSPSAIALDTRGLVRSVVRCLHFVQTSKSDSFQFHRSEYGGIDSFHRFVVCGFLWKRIGQMCVCVRVQRTKLNHWISSPCRRVRVVSTAQLSMCWIIQVHLCNPISEYSCIAYTHAIVRQQKLLQRNCCCFLFAEFCAYWNAGRRTHDAVDV